MRSLRSFALAAVWLLATVTLLGCTSGGSSAAVVADAGSSDAARGGYSIHVDTVLTRDDDGETLTFLTPALSVFSMSAAEVVGKPYYVAVFPGGFDQGVDLDLAHEWGTVPDDLHIRYVGPPRFATGPYDVSVIVYTKTEITQAIRDDFFPVAPGAGELSAFTLSHERILPGDPGFGNGVVRVNVEDADGELRLDNRHDTSDVPKSLTDTVLTVP